MLAQGDVDPFTLKLRNRDKHKGKFHGRTSLFTMPRKSMKDDTIKVGKQESHATDVRTLEIMCQRCWNIQNTIFYCFNVINMLFCYFLRQENLLSQFVFNMLNALRVGGKVNLIYIVLQGRLLTHFCTLENCISSDRKYHTFNAQAGVRIVS